MAAEPASPERSFAEDITWLRANMLRRLAAAGLVAGAAWCLYLTFIGERLGPRYWLAPLVLLASAFLAYRGAEGRWAPLAASLCAGGVAASVLLLAWAAGDSSLLLFLALPVGVAGLLIGPVAGLGAAAGTVVLLGALALLPARPLVPTALVWREGALAGLVAILLWVAMYPLRTTLEWSWRSYERAREQAEALRTHRGQLKATLKDLDGAYHHLEAVSAELERARGAAVEARRLKAEFAANISHELRTPLNLIIGFSEMMTMAPQTYEGQPLPPAYRGDMQAIYRSARHLAHLIDDVLDLSQIEAGRMGLAREPLALRAVVEEACSTVAGLFESKGLRIEAQVPADLPPVEADRTRLRQVLINLLNNAVRFTEQGGVTVTAVANGRDVSVSVADTGVGIAPEDLPKLFEEFRQLDGSTRRRYGGSGLGLAISKRFVELHGGRMWAESSPGQGTTFSFTLPLRPDLAISRLPQEWETWVRLPPAPAGEKVVVAVGEGPATARLFQRYLDGYRVLAAADDDEARKLASEQPVHAFILTSPSGEAGWQALRELREGLAGAPVIVCTLEGGPRSGQLARVAGYLVKPVSQERLLGALERLGEGVHSLLIVDDDPEVVRLLGRMVRAGPRPYRVLKAYGGEQALAMMRLKRPGAVVLDLLMPEVDGYTVIEHMQADERLREVPVIVVTAKGREEEAITAGLVGVTRRDGFSIGELMRSVKASLDSL